MSISPDNRDVVLASYVYHQTAIVCISKPCPLQSQRLVHYRPGNSSSRPSVRIRGSLILVECSYGYAVSFPRVVRGMWPTCNGIHTLPITNTLCPPRARSCRSPCSSPLVALSKLLDSALFGTSCWVDGPLLSTFSARITGLSRTSIGIPSNPMLSLVQALTLGYGLGTCAQFKSLSWACVHLGVSISGNELIASTGTNPTRSGRYASQMESR